MFHQNVEWCMHGRYALHTRVVGSRQVWLLPNMQALCRVFRNTPPAMLHATKVSMHKDGRGGVGPDDSVREWWGACTAQLRTSQPITAAAAVPACTRTHITVGTYHTCMYCMRRGRPTPPRRKRWLASCATQHCHQPARGQAQRRGEGRGPDKCAETDCATGTRRMSSSTPRGLIGSEHGTGLPYCSWPCQMYCVYIHAKQAQSPNPSTV